MNQSDRILHQALQGERLQLDDIVALFESDQIEKLGHTANQIMLRRHPEPITTFVVGRNVNYTNVCDVYCRFCAFYRAPGSKEGYVLPDETIFQKIQETIDVGGTEILMQGGTNPDLPFSYYLDLLRAIKERFPSITMHSFSPAEIRKMQVVAGNIPLEDVVRQLHEAGLDGSGGPGIADIGRRQELRLGDLDGLGSSQRWRHGLVEAGGRRLAHRTGDRGVAEGATAQAGTAGKPDGGHNKTSHRDRASLGPQGHANTHRLTRTQVLNTGDEIRPVR